MNKVALAQKLRLEQTPSERRFWAMLYTFRQSGWHFRRQAPIGPYIVDFVCKRARLVFEIDGESHFSEAGMAADRIRTQYLESRGYRVMRFTNHEVMTSGDGVYVLVSGILDEAGGTPT